jgi:hypothetical protein
VLYSAEPEINLERHSSQSTQSKVAPELKIVISGNDHQLRVLGTNAADVTYEFGSAPHLPWNGLICQIAGNNEYIWPLYQ